MGVSFTTFCQTCNVVGHEIGDQGMIGFPSLDDKKHHDDEWGVTKFNFGWIYTGFNAIKLNTYDVEGYKTFLEEHDGHNIILSTGYEDEEPDLDWDNLKEFEYPKDEFIIAFYELECKETGEKLRTTYADLFRQFEESVLPQDNINIFTQKIIDEQEINDAFYRVSAVIDPYEDLERIIEFISKNNGKTFIARLIQK